VVITGVIRKHGRVTSFEVERARVAVSGEDGGARGARVEVQPLFALGHGKSAHALLSSHDSIENLRLDASATPSRPSAR
jgi:hypothetical protein